MKRFSWLSSVWVGIVVLFFLFLFHIFISSDFGPGWDFPHHLKIGELRLGIDTRYPFESYPYGVLTDVVPVFIAETLPASLKPTSYFYISIFSGFIGVLFFYLFLRRYFFSSLALFSSVLLLSIPRFIGHLHINMKDTGSAAFFMATLYFCLRFFEKFQFRYAFFAIFVFTLAVNVKLNVLQLYPLLILWGGLILWTRRKNLQRLKRDGLLTLVFLLLLPLISLLTWYLLWPHDIFPFFQTIRTLLQLQTLHLQSPFYYSFQQLLETTPLSLLIFSGIGFVLCIVDFRKTKKLVLLVFPFLFIYTLIKYPVFGFPLIDDTRYFLDIYFAVSFLSIYAVFWVFRTYATFVSILLIGTLFYQSWSLHPYEISYANFLSEKKDTDFWAISYTEVFSYLNEEAPRESTVSARLAPELAYYLLRPDLRALLNSQIPSESDFVVLPNRQSSFKLFRVENFFARRMPTRVITTKQGLSLTFLYELRRKR